MTPLSTTATLPAPVDAVLALRTGERWVALRADRFGDDTTLESRETGPDGEVTVVVSRALPEGAPSFLQRFIPQDGRVRQSETWHPPGDDGACAGTWRVELPGAPARLGGTARLEPAAGGSRLVIEGEARVSVPLVGGRAEQFVVAASERLMEREAELMAEELGR